MRLVLFTLLFSILLVTSISAAREDCEPWERYIIYNDSCVSTCTIAQKWDGNQCISKCDSSTWDYWDWETMKCENECEKPSGVFEGTPDFCKDKEKDGTAKPPLLTRWKHFLFGGEKENCDPTDKGAIIELQGKAKINRGINTFDAAIGEKLIAGDVVVLNEGSTASLMLHDTGVLKLTDQTKFQIPLSTSDRCNIRPGIIKNTKDFWKKITGAKDTTDNEVATPTAVAGVRG